MLWFVIIMVLAIIGLSVLVGRHLSKAPSRQLSRQEKMNALKASGAMPQRKESN